MSTTEPKKLKGIVSISSDDFYSMNNQKDEKLIDNNQNINTKDSSSTTSNVRSSLKKPNSKHTTSSSSKSVQFQLPDNFFEQILNCEFRLKEKFEPKTFYQLINLYSSAINFYESIKDPRFITYNQSLNLLFSMPEVKKFMEGKKSLTKKERKNVIEKRFIQSEKRITKDRVKKLYLSKTEKNLGKYIVNEDFVKQTDLFRKRKEEKRKKYLLSTSGINDQKQNKSFDIINQDNDDFSNDIDNSFDNKKKIYQTSVKKSNPISLTNINGDNNNILDELKKEDLKNEINKISISGSGSEKNDDTLSFTNSDKILLGVNEFKRITNKTLFQENVKSSLDAYISEFYNIFFDKYMNPIVKDYTDNGNLIEKKLIDTSLEYYDQRTQMEYLMNGGDNDETYNDQLQSMLQQIADEEEESKLKILKEGEQRVNILNEKYMNSIDNFHIHKLEMLKEKLKLDITKSINSIVLK